MPCPETPGFSSKIRTPPKYYKHDPNTSALGNYRPFKIIQDNTITLAHSDEPSIKYGKFVETRFYEPEHKSKMWLLKTHSHTSERRGYGADQKRQEKKERSEAYP